MEEINFEDRRLFLRFNIDLPLRYFNISLNKKGRASTRNISANGIGIITDEELPAHSLLDIWLDAPDTGEVLNTKGEVVWSRLLEPGKYLVGVKLLNVDLMVVWKVLSSKKKTR